MDSPALKLVSGHHVYTVYYDVGMKMFPVCMDSHHRLIFSCKCLLCKPHCNIIHNLRCTLSGRQLIPLERIPATQLDFASLHLAVCCRQIHPTKDSQHPFGCWSTDNKRGLPCMQACGSPLYCPTSAIADAIFI